MSTGHRNDGRSDAPGARHGRVRWRWSADEPPHSPRVCGHRIAVVVGATLHVLDADASALARIPLGEGWLAALDEHGPVIATGTQVAALDWQGRARWQLALTQPVRAVQCSPFGELAIATHGTGHPPAGELLVVDDHGDTRWRNDDHAVVGAVMDAPELAFDDLGNLYTLLRGRLGDGVSGDDVATGGCRGFDRDGRPLWPRAVGPRFPQAIHGCARGVVIVGGAAHVEQRDEHGAIVWASEGDEADPFELAAPALVLVRPCRRLRLPTILHQRGPGVRSVLTGVHDRDDTFYFASLQWSPPRHDGLLALGADDRLRWHLPLAAIPYALHAPVIGPQASILLPHGDALLAIE